MTYTENAAAVYCTPLSENTAAGAAQNGCPVVVTAESNEAAYSSLCGLLEKDCTVLVKGSRGMHTEEVVRMLLADHRETETV